MKLDFRFIEIENFKSFTIAYLDFPDAGLHFVKGRNDVEPRLGSNGAGKSALFEAVAWCLYGKTPNGLRSPAIASRAGGIPTVSLGIRLDGKDHKITRSYYEGVKIAWDDGPTTQEAIEKTIGIPFEVFKHTVLLGQGQPLFFDLTPRDKLALISEVMRLERWEERSKKASEASLDLQIKIEHRLAVVGSLDHQLVSVLTDIELLGKQREDWQGRNDDLLAKAKKEIAEKSKRFTIIDDKRRDAALELDMAEMEIKALNKKLGDNNRTLSRYNEEHSYAARDVADLEKLVSGGECPTCGQKIARTSKLKFANKLLLARETLACLVIPSTLGVEFSIDKEALAEFHLKAARYQEILNDTVEEHAQLKACLDLLQPAAERIAKETNPYIEQHRLKKLHHIKLTEEIATLKEEIAELQKEWTHTNFWVKGFKDVRLFIIDDFMAELELASNVMTEHMGLEGWWIEYALEKETQAGTIQRGISVDIYRRGLDTPVKFETFSGGEAQRLRLLSALALSEVLLSHASVEVSLEILDEPTQHLSQEGGGDLCELLSVRAAQHQKTILLADHIVREGSRFSSTVSVVKDADGSHIEV